MRTKPLGATIRKWKIGRLMTPAVECPKCSRKTQSAWRCQWCKSVWTKEEVERVRERRLALIPKNINEVIK